MKQIRLAIPTLLFALPFCLQAQLILNPNPSRMIGQVRLPFSGDQLNLVEGRELNGPQAVAIDTSSTTGPMAVYVADTGNNRVLGWRDAANFANGTRADIVVGQRDFYSTLPLGPGTTLTSGLRAPTGIAVDRSGRLFVLDAGDNRILRFPRPFSQPDDLKLPDLVIGQNSTGANLPNQGGVVSAKTLSLTTGSSVYTSTLLFDTQWNLWVTDAGNHRVLRYPAARVGDGATNGPEADLALGQTDFATNTGLPISAQNRLVKGRLNGPSGLAFDRVGRLFVVDSLSRVLVFAPNPQTGIEAARVMGVVVQVPGQPAPTVVNDTGLLNPQGIVVINNTILVLDTGNHRIARFLPYDVWPAETPEKPSPAAQAIIGQGAFVSNAAARPNGGRAEPTNGTLYLPVQAVFSPANNGETFVVDSGNHRLLVFPDLSSGPPLLMGPPYEAKRVLGQIAFEYRAPNLVEGREMNHPQHMAVDTLASPPILYIADTFNNRILGYRDVRKLRPGDFADLVIGQPDFFRTVANYPSNDANILSASGLLQPGAVAVDGEGNLWVADTGNGRVLRFPRPFEVRQTLQRADMVIGQSDFTGKNTDATARTLAGPAGIAFMPEGHLLVSDATHNRVLFYRTPLASGMAAGAVYGQPDFFSSASGNQPNRLNGPRHISIDTNGRFYVADSGNNRVAIYPNPLDLGLDPSPAFSLTGLNSPQGTAVSSWTGEIWVAESRTNRTLRYPRFDQLITGGTQSNAGILLPSAPGITLGVAAVALDPFGNLLIADSGSRISIHFPGLSAANAANYLPRLSPGMYATLRPVLGAPRFSEETKVFNEVAFPPMTKSLGDIQVLVADQPAPLHFVSPEQINAFIPMTAPSSGTVEIQVVRVSTGQILASYPVQMDVASPGLFTANASGTGQLAALNQDNSLNTPGNPIARGQVIQLFGTGQGFVPGAVPDGQPSSGLVSTQWLPRVVIGTAFVADADIQYSGFAPLLVGLWQINVKISDTVAPGAAVVVVVVQRDIPSNNPQVPLQIRTTIAVKQ